MSLYKDRLAEILPDVPIKTTVTNEDGLQNIVFLINDQYVVRFARDERGAQLMQIEALLLSKIASQMPVAVPTPFYAQEDAMAYRMIHGEILTLTHLRRFSPEGRKMIAEDVGRFLHALHHYQLTDEDYALFLPTIAPCTLERWEQIAQDVEQYTYPYLLPHQRDDAKMLFDQFLNDPRHFAYRPRLIHGDLAPYHLFANRATQRLSGVIDFGIAGIGDPALDIGTLLQCFGESFVQAIAPTYPELASFLPRARFYAQAIELQWVTAGIQHNQPFWFTAHLGGARDLFL